MAAILVPQSVSSPKLPSLFHQFITTLQQLSIRINFHHPRATQAAILDCPDFPRKSQPTEPHCPGTSPASSTCNPPPPHHRGAARIPAPPCSIRLRRSLTKSAAAF
ncbi:hypothetical protein M0R45_019430 [Rubus argutus]|uniref:Uncharacterized protein n=1 Tax=Rubus argutus TaxID=59490 RepID=A0AAW1X5C6_RUBAR